MSLVKQTMPSRILLADDDESLRLLVHATLDESDHEILEASDGSEALLLARAAKPDLIVIDWMMPGMTGVEVTEALRADDEMRRVPIIL